MTKIMVDIGRSERKELIIEEFSNVGFTNYYLQIFDNSCEFNTRIKLLLKFIGMDPALPGTVYTKEAVKILHNFKNDYVYASMLDIYDEVAEMFNVTPQVVESAIRRTKEKMLEHIEPKIKLLIFGGASNIENSKIRNTIFIQSLVDFMLSFEI